HDGHSYRVYNWKTHGHFECNEILIKLYDIFTCPQTVEQGLERFHAAHHCPGLTLKQVVETYYPELEKVFYLNLVRLADPKGSGFFMGEE
ncbi:MAG: hypothetical protein DRH26_14330, partial [Deltaproteobacteria bacterium]